MTSSNHFLDFVDIFLYFSKDIFYGKIPVAKAIVEEFCIKNNLCAEIVFQDRVQGTFGNTSSAKVAIEVFTCWEYCLARRQDSLSLPYNGDDPSQLFGFYVEAMLRTWIENGLKHRKRERCKEFDIYAVDHFDLLRMGNIYEITHEALYDFLAAEQLPYPTSLFPAETNATEKLIASIEQNSCGWRIENYLEAVRAAAKELSAANPVKMDSDWDKKNRFSYVKISNAYIINYSSIPCSLPATLGIHYLAFLIRNSGKTFSCAEVEADCNYSKNKNAQITTELYSDSCSNETETDRVAVTDYKNHIKQLIIDIEKAQSTGDEYSLSKLTKERASIEEHLKTVVTSKGAPRRSRNPDAEKCRKRVCNAIGAGLKKIKEINIPLFQHLSSKSALRLGTMISYTSPPDITWATEPLESFSP